jgi:hypothetical protein
VDGRDLPLLHRIPDIHGPRISPASFGNFLLTKLPTFKLVSRTTLRISIAKLAEREGLSLAELIRRILQKMHLHGEVSRRDASG